MDIKAIINSGVLEEYVLGTASEQDMKAVRCLSSVYPELLAEIEKIEADVIRTGESLVPEALEFDLDKLDKRIEETEQLPVMQIQDDSRTAVREKEARVVQMNASNRIWRVAASFLILASVGLLWFGMDQKAQKNELAQTLNEISSNVDELGEQLASNSNMQRFLLDPSVEKITLNSTDTSVTQFASVFWSTSNSEVYLDVTALPQPPEGKQYQLWTLVGGNPVDQGVVPLDSSGLLRMKNAKEADAFAITLEDEGGKPAPTLSELKVLGEV